MWLSSRERWLQQRWWLQQWAAAPPEEGSGRWLKQRRQLLKILVTKMTVINKKILKKMILLQLK
jgi:hypothetical protein